MQEGMETAVVLNGFTLAGSIFIYASQIIGANETLFLACLLEKCSSQWGCVTLEGSLNNYL